MSPALTHPGFLADIIAEPDADAPRLIFADWLEDHGEPERAAFIRHQIAAGVATSLVGGHDSLGWFPGTHLAGDRAEYVVRRGFVESVTLPWGVWLEHHAGLRVATPLREVRLTTRPDVGWDSGPGWVEYHLEGGRSRVRQGGRLQSTHDAVPYLLAAEWPGIRFVLPA